MPDRLSKLEATLTELEAELTQVESLDEGTRAHLAQIAQEIMHVVSKGAPLAGTRAVDSAHLRERAERFEESHPQLASIVFRIVDLLGQVGI